MTNNPEAHVGDTAQNGEHGLSGHQRANAVFLEFAGSSALAGDALNRIGADWRLSFLVGAVVTAVIEVAKNKLQP